MKESYVSDINKNRRFGDEGETEDLGSAPRPKPKPAEPPGRTPNPVPQEGKQKPQIFCGVRAYSQFDGGHSRTK